MNTEYFATCAYGREGKFIVWVNKPGEFCPMFPICDFEHFLGTDTL
jgi:hypothetical protein